MKRAGKTKEACLEGLKSIYRKSVVASSIEPIKYQILYQHFNRGRVFFIKYIVTYLAKKLLITFLRPVVFEKMKKTHLQIIVVYDVT